jgi:hypothetical protein
LYILSVFSSSKCSLFHNSTVFGSCIFHILYTGALQLKKNSGAKRLRFVAENTFPGGTMQCFWGTMTKGTGGVKWSTQPRSTQPHWTSWVHPSTALNFTQYPHLNVIKRSIIEGSVPAMASVAHTGLRQLRYGGPHGSGGGQSHYRTLKFV